ncbi:FHA domain-containing protein [Gloeobacter morelensis]|uniref:FHA domain-containing protein n=1 Tax=Gloeobacter morelensis MG652769 TaxID=2781736 RepID=A0ABY3PGD5_9CYAN|nr:FHA domain-containing protein [Gloeobacter morelensis]UFP92598.1 FHA domain-containing protein [Gloeobacter morelensis MG652769]
MPILQIDAFSALYKAISAVVRPIPAAEHPPQPLPLSAARIQANPSHPYATYLQDAVAALIYLGTNTRLELPLQSAVYIGRANSQIPPDIDVGNAPDSAYVSRVHAVIRLIPGGTYTLEDAGSANGTYLNGEALKPGARFRRPLVSGDIIALGKGERCRFIFVTDDS